MSKKNRKFNQIWCNQTNLGKKFGISSVAVGKLLIAAGLKDNKTKQATKKALDEGYAKSTPLKDGTPYFMWNIEKVSGIIAKDHKPLSKVDYWVREVQRTLKEADELCDEGNDKLGYLLSDCAFDEVPKEISQEVRDKVSQLTEVK